MDLDTLRRNPNGIRFRDLCKLCDEYFGEPRQTGSSHRIYRTPLARESESEHSKQAWNGEGVSGSAGT